MFRVFEFSICKDPEFYGDVVASSKVTDETFLLCFGTRDPAFPVLSELRNMLSHVRKVRKMVKSGLVKFAGNQVIYCGVYC